MCRFTKHFALLIAMLLASIQYGLSATSYDYEEKIDGVTAYFTFNSEDRTLNLVGVSANLVGNFDVPSKASNGLKITSIGEQAFRDCTGLTSVVIPNSVTSIGGGAFYGCTRLTSVSIPNSVTSIGSGAFYGCTSLTSVSIPNSVTSIGINAFYNCESLTSVSIPNSVTSIGENAFGDCESLTSISIPNSVTSIGINAFYRCTGLTSVSIPNSVTSIGKQAFYGCTGLTSVSIPNSVTSIGKNAFCRCTGLTSISIPNSVTSIGGVAFYGCKSLMSVKLYGENPPECPSDANAFGQQNVMFVLYVPVGTKDKYRSHYAYKIYYIEEFDPEEDPFDSNNDVKTIVADEYDGVIDVYNMYGVKVLSTYKKDEIDNLQKGIYVVKVGQKTDKYIVK